MAALTLARPSSHRPLLIALLVLIVARLAVILCVHVTPGSDPAWYYERAIGLVEHGSYSEGGYPTAFWPVGYPAFLAAVLAVFGRSVLAGQLANVALSAICLVLTYRWCMQRWGDRRIAALAGLLLAVYPNHIGYSAALYSEPLYTALLLGICVVVRPGAGIGRLVAVGVMAGLATLVKAQMQLLAPPLIWLMLLPDWRRASLWDATRRALLATLVMLATMAPWTWRNYEQFGMLIPVSTNGGMSLLAANNPSMTLDLSSEFAEEDPLVQSVGFSVEDQAAADVRARAAAKKWIVENPGRFIALMPKKILRLWLWDGESEWMFQRGDPDYERHQVWFRTARVINQVFYVVVLAAGLWAAWRLIDRRDPSTLVLPLLLAYFTAICMVFSGQSRYHAPLMPFIIAAGAWTALRYARRRSPP